MTHHNPAHLMLSLERDNRANTTMQLRILSDSNPSIASINQDWIGPIVSLGGRRNPAMEFGAARAALHYHLTAGAYDGMYVVVPKRVVPEWGVQNTFPNAPRHDGDAWLTVGMIREKYPRTAIEPLVPPSWQ